MTVDFIGTGARTNQYCLVLSIVYRTRRKYFLTCMHNEPRATQRSLYRLSGVTLPSLLLQWLPQYCACTHTFHEPSCVCTKNCPDAPVVLTSIQIIYIRPSEVSLLHPCEVPPGEAKFTRFVFLTAATALVSDLIWALDSPHPIEWFPSRRGCVVNGQTAEASKK